MRPSIWSFNIPAGNLKAFDCRPCPGGGDFEPCVGGVGQVFQV